MLDLDECVARAVASPVAEAPDLVTIQRGATRHRRQRFTARAVAVVGVVLAVSVGTVAITRSSSGTSRIETGSGGVAAPGTTTDPGAITRPLLDSCTATRTVEGRSRGSGTTDPAQPAEVFAVPDRGGSGPLALVVRLAGVSALSVSPNTTIAGQPGRVDLGEQGQGGITWLLPGGGNALVYSRDLTAPELVALAETITAATPLPAGLVSLGSTTEASWARSSCTDPQGSMKTVEVVHGPRADRYTRLLDNPPGVRWDDGDATFLVVSVPPTTSNPPPIRQATTEEWDALLAAGRPPSPTSTTVVPNPAG